MSSSYESESDTDHENGSDVECVDESNPESNDELDSESNNESDPENDSDPEHEKESNPKGKISQGGLISAIISTLRHIKTPYSFAYSNVDFALPNPCLQVPPLGTLGLPLSTDDAQKIISLASQSLREKTSIDSTVSRNWELDSKQFSLKNHVWNETMKNIVDSVTTALGLKRGTGMVSAKLDKLLLYEPGAFSKPRKDSEKTPGMFATLVVCLPSPHKGGELVLTHDNEKHEFETASSSSFGCSYAAWYTDVTHEVLPVESGYRLVLLYSLVQQPDFKIPSHDLARGHVKQLMTLLEQYNSRLKAGDEKLAPMLLHKLKHGYSQGNLKLKTLKPPDFARVLTLSQVAAKLGFDVFLATLELTVISSEDRWGSEEEVDRFQSLVNMVKLDGKLVEKSFKYPTEMDPVPQDKEDPDQEEREDDEEVEGYKNITQYYRDTVVVLVPPSKKLDFIFRFKSSGKVVSTLFCKLIQKLATDPMKKQELEQLCEMALKPKRKDENRYYSYQSQFKKPIPLFCQQAAAFALDLGRMDLFDNACDMTCDKIMLANAHALGRWAAANGVATMTDRLMKGVLVAPSVAKKVKVLREVAEGFERVKPKPSVVEKEHFKKWSDKAITRAVANLKTLRKADGVALAQLCARVDWSQFASKTKILEAVTMTKITFADELMSTLGQKLDNKQRTFIEIMIRSIWKEFVFNAKFHKSPVQKSRLESERKDYLKVDDIFYIVEKTVEILSSRCVETTIIPGMLNAIRNASGECTKELFIPLVQMILKNKLVGFRLSSDDADPRLALKRIVQALLTKFLRKSVSPKKTLSKLEKTESAKGRLKAYLQPYYSIIMSANINKLPNLEYLLTVQSSETDENAAPARNQLKPTTHKRGTSSDLSEEELAKRMKS